MSQDTARTYYARMMEAEVESTKTVDPAMVNLTMNQALPSVLY